MLRLLCLIFGHIYTVDLRFSGHNGGDVKLLSCERCQCRWIMSDDHQAFLRYDNDPTFRDDIRRMYPKVPITALGLEDP